MRVAKGILVSAFIAGGGWAEPLRRAAAAPVVDLGYGVYEGNFDAANNINVFKGIRYAAPPLGPLRFAAPQAPVTNRTKTAAKTDPPYCPQTGASSKTPAAYGFTSGPGNEDCLFLNVYAPANAKNLPVFFWIHGGGYGLFSATGLDPTEFLARNNNGFISVIIQYRLGAFGFLASPDVQSGGALNAGLLDMNFALKWVQSNIGKFGGDPSRVTIAGESAGASAVLYQAMAYGGKQKENLFQNVITSSPWFPFQYKYYDPQPVKAYYDFVQYAGCGTSWNKLQCLRGANTATLQNASAKVSEAGPFGTFAFLPVTDFTFVQTLPSQQLMSKSMKGKRVLSGSMSNDGVPLAPPTTKTLQDFRDYVSITFPWFNTWDKAAVEWVYSFQGDQADVNPNAAKFVTSGTGYPTAVNVSEFGTGQQQRVINVYAEYAFVCPSYWAAAAFPQGWKYQFTAPPSYHGYDLQALWSGTPTPGASFKSAYRKMFGNFIIKNNPVITVDEAKGGVATSVVPPGDGSGGAANIKWPQWDASKPYLLNLNTTGGTPVHVTATEDLQFNLYLDPGVKNFITVADAVAWEGGRGKRCDFWKAIAPKIPA